MNDRVKADLAEEFMPLALSIASEMGDGSIPEEDLGQEAFVGLMEGLEILSRADEDEYGERLPLEETIEEAIRARIREALAEQKALAERDDRLIAQVELMNKSISRLTEELGSKPTVDELANDMGISQVKVLEILKLTGETLPEDELTQAARGLWMDNPMMKDML